MEYTKPLAQLIDQFQKLPGIGPKSAQRMAFFMLKMPLSEVEKFAKKIKKEKKQIKYCHICFNMSSQDPCEICSSHKRTKDTICVVAETKDLTAIEKTHEFKGMYHVLQGLISPIDGITPEDLRIKELLQRVADDEVKEVIFAINPSVEGDATTLYLSKLLKPFGVKLTRIAFGLPMGSELEYVDELTLARAMEGRREI